MSRAAMITRLSTVTVMITDLDRSLAFYRDVLGFEVRDDYDLGHGRRWLTVAPPDSQTAILLWVPDRNLLSEKAYIHARACIGTGQGMFFLTDDIMKTHRELSARGATFTQAPYQEAWGGWQARFLDPDGNWFELVQMPEPERAA